MRPMVIHQFLDVVDGFACPGYAIILAYVEVPEASHIFGVEVVGHWCDMVITLAGGSYWSDWIVERVFDMIGFSRRSIRIEGHFVKEAVVSSAHFWLLVLEGLSIFFNIDKRVILLEFRNIYGRERLVFCAYDDDARIS